MTAVKARRATRTEPDCSQSQVPCAEYPVKADFEKAAIGLGEGYGWRRLIKQMLARLIQCVTFCRNEEVRE